MRRSSYDCLTEREVEQFVLNRLDEPVLSSVEEHLLVCGGCLERVEQEERFVDELKAASTRLEAEQKAGVGAREGSRSGVLAFFRPSRTWAAAGLMACTLLLAIVFMPGRDLATRSLDVALVLERSGGLTETAVAPSGADLRLMMDLTELPPAERYRLELVDHQGRRLASGEAPRKDGWLAWSPAKRLSRGSYWVRLMPVSGDELLREFALRVE